jgi:predicted metalloprotease
MRLGDQRRSKNYEERSGGGGGGGGGLPVRMGGLGVGGIIVVVLIMLFAPAPVKNFVIGMLGGAPGAVEQSAPDRVGEASSEEGVFLQQVLGSTEDVWSAIFVQGGMAAYGVPAGTDYPETTLVNFDGSVGTSCGGATSAIGPFYCPADARVYIDTQFFDELSRRFGAPGDFAQAYVISHEVGHHIQNILGLTEKVSRAAGGGAGADGPQVRLELQADCFAGVWGRIAGDQTDAQGMRRLEPGDLEEAMAAANAIGDDTLQRQARGKVVPDSFTHGSSEQRMRWFRRGYDSADPGMCDTFAARTL